MQANITQLLKEQEKTRQVIAEAEQAKKELSRIKSEAKKEELIEHIEEYGYDGCRIL